MSNQKIAVVDATGEVREEVGAEVGIAPRGDVVLITRVAERQAGSILLSDGAAASLAEKYGYRVLAVGSGVRDDLKVGDRVAVWPGSEAAPTPNKGQRLIRDEDIVAKFYDGDADEG